MHNFGNRPVRLRLGSVDPEATLRPLMASVAERAARRADEPIALGGYGYVWFRVDDVRR